MEVEVSNMNKNSNKIIIVKKAHPVNKLQQKRQKFLQEEFGAELHPGSANDFAEKQRSTEKNQPVSERTAWN